MIGLARFVLRGRSQAVLIISVFAMIAMAIPLLAPLMVISGAALALVTLSNVLSVTLTVVGLAYLFCAGILMALGIFAESLELLVFWLPVVAGAEALRRGKNLAIAILLLLLIVVAAVLAFFILVPDPAALWSRQFDQLLAQLLQIPEFSQRYQLTQQELDAVAYKMTGFVAAWFFITLTACLLIGRWWQGRLVNPGGFKREFNNLRLGRILSVIVVASIVAATVFETQLLLALSAVLVTVYLFQGLAVIHAFTADQQKSKVWLIVFYILMLLFPQIVVMVSLWGLVDTWLDSRRRWLKAGGN
jgi:hypothetical protein